MTLPTEDDRKAARELLDTLYAAIKHGDAAHQDWLRGTFDAYETALAQFRADAMRVEREACAHAAEICDGGLGVRGSKFQSRIAEEIAQAIRERGGE